MQFPILNPAVQKYIDDHIGDDVSALALTKNPFPEAAWPEILGQIAAKSKSKTKLPTWFAAANIIFPEKISVEQTSSETTAKYKASLISGKSLIDLTGGFGVDDYYFSKKTDEVTACEINQKLSEIAQHNFEQLGAANIQCIVGDSYEIMKNLGSKFDWIYIDPSRRSDAKGKVFMLKDCQPNVPALLDYYFKFSSNILIKTAPILDISAGLSELKCVKSIHIVAVENEVKELLWEISEGYSGEIHMQSVNIVKEKEEIFDFVVKRNNDIPVFSLPKKYLFEPNSAIMKSGGFDEVALQFGLGKLHQHSHLYTSDDLKDFPGRVFKIEKSILYHKSDMQTFLSNTKANLTTRNFPDSVESIRRKWKIKDGGDRYCFFTTDLNNNKIVLICTKIK